MRYYDVDSGRHQSIMGRDGAINTNIKSSEIMQPVDIQGRYAQTIQTHSGVTVGPSSGSLSSWIDCNGFSDIAFTFMNNGATTAHVEAQWSNDGVNFHGYEAIMASGTGQQRVANTPIKARYLRVNIYNGHTAPATINAWAYLKA